jgi:transcriptional repressor NrdR
MYAMKCPYCSYLDSKVVDSRPAEDGASIRRRRECLHCRKRFTTFEVMESLPVVVIKKDGTRQTFDRNKLLNGMLRACDKRRVSFDTLERIVDEIESSLQNEMNRKLIQRQHVITFFGVLTIIGLIALAVSQIRLAKTRKQEAETNANLFHFMQQNKSLVESNMSQERKVLDATQQLSDMYFAKFKTMQKLSFSIENPKNKIALKELEKAVFGDGEHWDGVIDVLDVLYPGLWESITFKYPEMEEMERRVFILSRFKLSRMEEAALLGISTSVLDKLRTRVHKIVEQEKKQ